MCSINKLAVLAQEAIDVQGACNLSGVVVSWAQSIQMLRFLLGDIKHGGLVNTDMLNHHPINVMFAHKVAQLTASAIYYSLEGELGLKFSEAYYHCQILAGGRVDGSGATTTKDPSA